MEYVGIVAAAVIFVVTGVELLGITADYLKMTLPGKTVWSFFRRIFVEEGWHLLWYALPVGVVAALWRRRFDQATVAAGLSLVCAFILLAFVFTSTGFASRGGQDAVPRHLLHLAPAALFLCAVIWSRLLGDAAKLGVQRGNAH